MTYELKGQVRYFADSSEWNYPNGVNRINLTTGEIFKDFLPANKITIQTSVPGVEFIINYNPFVTRTGTTGYYEIELPSEALIYNLQFSPNLPLWNDNGICQGGILVDFYQEKRNLNGELENNNYKENIDGGNI